MILQMNNYRKERIKIHKREKPKPIHKITRVSYLRINTDYVFYLMKKYNVDRKSKTYKEIKRFANELKFSNMKIENYQRLENKLKKINNCDMSSKLYIRKENNNKSIKTTKTTKPTKHEDYIHLLTELRKEFKRRFRLAKLRKGIVYIKETEILELAKKHELINNIHMNQYDEGYNYIKQTINCYFNRVGINTLLLRVFEDTLIYGVTSKDFNLPKEYLEKSVKLCEDIYKLYITRIRQLRLKQQTEERRVANDN